MKLHFHYYSYLSEKFITPPREYSVSMGRTIPTWRNRMERRIDSWMPFRRVLRRSERDEFDLMLKSVRSRSSACGMLPASDVLEPALLVMLIDINSRLTKLEEGGNRDG